MHTPIRLSYKSFSNNKILESFHDQVCINCCRYKNTRGYKFEEAMVFLSLFGEYSLGNIMNKKSTPQWINYIFKNLNEYRLNYILNNRSNNLEIKSKDNVYIELTDLDILNALQKDRRLCQRTISDYFISVWHKKITEIEGNSFADDALNYFKQFNRKELLLHKLEKFDDELKSCSRRQERNVDDFYMVLTPENETLEYNDAMRYGAWRYILEYYNIAKGAYYDWIILHQIYHCQFGSFDMHEKIPYYDSCPSKKILIGYLCDKIYDYNNPYNCFH